MHILVTGAGGFVGQQLVRRLLADHSAADSDSALSVTLLDVSVGPVVDSRTRVMEGDLTDPTLMRDAMSGAVDVVYHLASVPGGAAERDYELGRRVNLDGTARLLEEAGALATVPRFVFASSIAVYGDRFPSEMDESSPARPATSYGAQKLIGEILVADATRRGTVQGCSLRLPGVVARPAGPSGLVSAFMSNMFWAMRDGTAITLPVSESATAWWISQERCVDNLLHAGNVEFSQLSRGTYLMPVLRLSMTDVLEALAARFGRDRLSLISFAPEPKVEALFGSYPSLSTHSAELAGFRSDGTVSELISRIFAAVS